MTFALLVVAAVYAVSIVFVTALFARALLRERALPESVAQPLTPETEHEQRASVSSIAKTA